MKKPGLKQVSKIALFSRVFENTGPDFKIAKLLIVNLTHSRSFFGELASSFSQTSGNFPNIWQISAAFAGFLIIWRAPTVLAVNWACFAPCLVVFPKNWRVWVKMIHNESLMTHNSNSVLALNSDFSQILPFLVAADSSGDTLPTTKTENESFPYVVQNHQPKL